LSSFVLFISFLLIISEPEKIELAFNGSLISDAFSNVTKTVIVVSSIICLLISKDFLTKKKINAFEYFVIFLFSVLGLLLLASSFDLLTLYLALEIQSFSFYILASFKRDDSYSTEAGLKYFLLGAIASGMLLFGCSLVYGFAGSIHFENLSKIFLGSIEFSNESFFGVVIALLFINVALLFKLGIAPFHS
jgi:NADH-quinone oxidoreductase subunit N